MNNYHDHIIEMEKMSGFETCKICHAVILYECEYCYSITQTKSANYNCPARRQEEDEGLGIENINWDLIKYRRHIYC